MNAGSETSPGRVYLLRGNGWIFSRGLAVLAARFRAAGLQAHDWWCRGYRRARREVIADHRAGRPTGPLAFVGHSCGGKYSLVAAASLAEHGIPVELVVAIDSAWAPPVPSNVRRAVHLYLGGRRLYPALPLTGADEAPRIDNIDLRSAGSPIPAVGLHHLNITSRPALQDWVFAAVMHALRRGS